MRMKPWEFSETKLSLPEWNLSNNKSIYEEIIWYRETFSDELVGDLKKLDFAKSNKEAIENWTKVVFDIISVIQQNWYHHNDSDPGHWLWHFLRDILHAWVILWNIDEKSTKITPNEIFVSFIAWALHDVWCIFVDRYADATSINKHAEIWSVIVWKILKSLKLPEEIVNSVVWWIMAHTNMRKEQAIEFEWEKYTSPVYKDEMEDKTPINFVSIPRQIDRLDTNWLLFVCRHILTRYRTITDFSTHWYSTQSLYTHGQINWRPWTMLQHFKMFLRSNSAKKWVYNKHDIPTMVGKRDKYSWILKAFIDRVEWTKEKDLIKWSEINEVLEWFLDFLDKYVEPKPHWKKADYIYKLRKEFLTLRMPFKRRWLTQLSRIKDYYPLYIQSLIEENETTKKISKIVFPWTNKTIWDLVWYNDNDVLSRVDKIVWL